MRLLLPALMSLAAGCLPAPVAGDTDTGAGVGSGEGGGSGSGTGSDDTGCAEPRTWYRDADGDYYGDEGDTVEGCDAPQGYVDQGEDCDDSDATVSPAATESCADDLDNDCDGVAASCGHEGASGVSDRAAATLLSTHSGAGFGASLSYADLDGSHPPQVVVGAPGEDTLYAFDLPLLEQQIDEDAARVVKHTSEGVGFGWAITGVRGATGMVASAVGDSRDHAEGGAVYFFSTVPEGGIDTELADGVVTSSELYQHLGYDLVDLGDFTRDAVPDILIGSSATSSTSLVAVVMADHTGEVSVEEVSRTWEGEVGDSAGSAVARAEDINGDGLNDALVGGWSAGAKEGAAWLLLGPATSYSALEDADWMVEGTNTYQALGWSVAGLGDDDGDGYGEIAIASPGTLRVDIHRGTGDSKLVSLQAKITATTLESDFGHSLEAVGDVDGDRVPDLLVGAPGATPKGADSGSAYLFYGPFTGSIMAESDAPARFDGVGAGGRLGSAFGQGIDLDGDEGSELLLGAPGLVNDELGTGQVWLVPAAVPPGE